MLLLGKSVSQSRKQEMTHLGKFRTLIYTLWVQKASRCHIALNFIEKYRAADWKGKVIFIKIQLQYGLCSNCKWYVIIFFAFSHKSGVSLKYIDPYYRITTSLAQHWVWLFKSQPNANDYCKTQWQLSMKMNERTQFFESFTLSKVFCVCFDCVYIFNFAFSL